MADEFDLKILDAMSDTEQDKDKEEVEVEEEVEAVDDDDDEGENDYIQSYFDPGENWLDDDGDDDEATY